MSQEGVVQGEHVAAMRMVRGAGLKVIIVHWNEGRAEVQSNL
jgi:hypothetical protein